MAEQKTHEPSRILKPLTKAVAEKLGHVLWIIDNDAQSAYRRMYEGLQKAPYNFAVWADAGRQIDPAQLSLLKAWRAANTLKSPDNHVEYQSLVKKMTLSKIDDKDLIAQAPAYLSAYFNRIASQNARKPDAAVITAFLEGHTRQMVFDLLKSLPVRDIRASIRAMKTTSETAMDFAHTDGKGYMGRNLRFLQSLASPSTCIVANDSATRVAITETVWSYRAKPGHAVTFWQAPENAVVVITNELHHCQPILHSEAPTLPGKKPAPRTVLVCDLTA
ncbi:MAG: hypothetical protein ACXW30_00760 [Micavibrio sp.]